MYSIIYTILLFNILIICFKLFEKFKVDNLQALITNYAVCAFFSLLLIETDFSIIEVIKKQWIYHALTLGSLFIIVFNLYAYGVQKIGIATTTLYSRMSLIIPVFTAIILYPEEKLNSLQIGALFLAFIGIIFASIVKQRINLKKKYLLIPILVFLGQGLADSIFNDFTKKFNHHDPFMFFFILFTTACIVGSIILIPSFIKNKRLFDVKNLYWGAIFGIPNFFSLFTFLEALNNIKSTIVFPLICMGIIITSSLIGIILFNEKISKLNWVGIMLCLSSIYIFTYNV